MKILAIRGKNIASLEGEFAVDFTIEPLASANIFAISGPTGSGKSSLLDTMCLALFSRTPRTDQAKEQNVRLHDISDDALVQSDPRFLLRRGTANGYAETDFVALNGHRYRARWSVSRARDKESGRLQNPKPTLFNIDKDAEEQGTRSELQQKIIDLIGLTFEQFTRSVLLAQNDFSTFLKAEQGEKAALLEKLTGTELFSRISKRIFERNTEAKTAFEAIQSQISGIELLTCDMCDEIRTVHSLSGGESFLVSLALALGLSSLSSNRMKVKSLFIDEGFGSLDAETLRIAMDALENLRTQGRKIGVISHVQEMTERIPVEIKITRLGSGRSSIEII